MTEEENCVCNISGLILQPSSYMKVISHDFRKEILHKRELAQRIYMKLDVNVPVDVMQRLRKDLMN